MEIFQLLEEMEMEVAQDLEVRMVIQVLAFKMETTDLEEMQPWAEIMHLQEVDLLEITEVLFKEVLHLLLLQAQEDLDVEEALHQEVQLLPEAEAEEVILEEEEGDLILAAVR